MDATCLNHICKPSRIYKQLLFFSISGAWKAYYSLFLGLSSCFIVQWLVFDIWINQTRYTMQYKRIKMGMLITPIYALRAAMNTWLVVEIYAKFHESVCTRVTLTSKVFKLKQFFCTSTELHESVCIWIWNEKLAHNWRKAQCPKR